jgi:hypothetical protein
MKTFVINHIKQGWVFLAFVLAFPVSAQIELIEAYNGTLTQAQTAQVERLLAKESTKRLRVVSINMDAFKHDVILVKPFSDAIFQLGQIELDHPGIELPYWSGNHPPTFSSGTFVLMGKRVSGHVSGIRGNFEIFPMGSEGVHAVVEHDNSAFGGCGTAGDRVDTGFKGKKYNDIEHVDPNGYIQNRDGSIVKPDKNSNYNTPEAHGDECFIRVLVAYTALAQSETMADFGRTMIEHISLAVLESNQGYANSLVEQRMELAYLYETATNESNNACNDNTAQNDPNDGRWDELYTLRATYDADMSCVITGGLYAANANCNPNGGLCGRAFGFDYTDPDNMFQVTEYDCATGNFTFAHEFGHNQGCRHDNDGTQTPFTYARGLNEGTNFRTIMAVCCTPIRINWWSNPDVNYLTFGATGTATRDNARALDVGDASYSHHQTATASINTAAIILDDHYASYFGTVDVESSNIAESGSQLDIKSFGVVKLMPGHHSKSGSVMRAYLTNTCPGTSYAKSENDPLVQSDIQYNITMSVYPNPFNEQLTIMLAFNPNSVLNLFVTDPQGRVLQFIATDLRLVTGGYEATIATGSLPAGIYYIVADCEGERTVQKLVKTQ